jgi:curved DNA-binding protein CbpA
MDSEKRSLYDRQWSFGSRHQDGQRTYATGQSRQGHASFEDIFRDILNNPETRKVFAEMQQEFARKGIRFDSSFLNNLFFGGRGFFFGGIFTFGPHGAKTSWNSKMSAGFNQHVRNTSSSERDVRIAAKNKPGLWQKIGQKFKQLAWGQPEAEDKDMHFSLPLSAQEAYQGTEVTIAIERDGKQERLRVKVPPGSRQGTVLRLRYKGRSGKEGEPPGDAYLQLNVNKSAQRIR